MVKDDLDSIIPHDKFNLYMPFTRLLLSFCSEGDVLRCAVYWQAGSDSGTQTWAHLSPATDPSNHIRSSPVLIISPPRDCTWQHTRVNEFEQHECSCATSKLEQTQLAEGEIQKQHHLIPEGQSRANYSKPCSEVERVFLQIVNPQLNCMAGSAQMSPYRQRRCLLLRWCAWLCLGWKWDRGGLFLSHSVSEVAKDVSPPKAKNVLRLLALTYSVSLSYHSLVQRILIWDIIILFVLSA